MQRLSITKGHAFILVYSVCSRQSFEEIRPIWHLIREIKAENLSQIPVMVGEYLKCPRDQQFSHRVYHVILKSAIKLTSQRNYVKSLMPKAKRRLLNGAFNLWKHQRKPTIMWRNCFRWDEFMCSHGDELASKGLCGCAGMRMYASFTWGTVESLLTSWNPILWQNHQTNPSPTIKFRNISFQELLNMEKNRNVSLTDSKSNKKKGKSKKKEQNGSAGTSGEGASGGGKEKCQVM